MFSPVFMFKPIDNTKTYLLNITLIAPWLIFVCREIYYVAMRLSGKTIFSLYGIDIEPNYYISLLFIILGIVVSYSIIIGAKWVLLANYIFYASIILFLLVGLTTDFSLILFFISMPLILLALIYLYFLSQK